MERFDSLKQIDYGELERQIVQAVNSCVQDIHQDQDQLTEPRQVSVTVKLTPDTDGNIDVSYDVIAKLAKRKGTVRAYVDREGTLILGEREAQGVLPLHAETKSSKSADAGF